MLDQNFIAIFEKMQMDLGLPVCCIDEIIDKASDEQIDIMNFELDDLQHNL